MLVTALWYAEQQFRWSDKHFSSTKENQPWHFATAPFYLAPMAVIASSPYLGIASAAGNYPGTLNHKQSVHLWPGLLV